MVQQTEEETTEEEEGVRYANLCIVGRERDSRLLVYKTDRMLQVYD
jgi:hypothetical protein